MSTDLELPIFDTASFPRPTSLFTPERISSGLVDSSGYSPFPTFPGSARQHDPYGLNAYLLHPEDSLWDYVQPVPAPSPTRSSSFAESLNSSPNPPPVVAPVDLPVPDLIPPTRTTSMRKQHSLGNIRKKSPLAQSPLVQEISPRKRSNSVDSITLPSPNPELEAGFIPPMEMDINQSTDSIASASIQTKSVGKKGFRSALHKARKSFMPTNTNTTSESSSSASSSTLKRPNLGTPRPSEEVEMPTPVPLPSQKSSSEISSISSTSSSEGIRTPNDTEVLSELTTSSAVKLADALEIKKNNPSTWRGWLGGKRDKSSSSKLREISPASSNPGSPNLSASNSVESLTSKVSPFVGTTSESKHPWVGQHLRRSSLRKITCLRKPSPHPLALHLRRQYGLLPDEVAFALQAGQRAFPFSINAYNPTSRGGLIPAEGGLRTSLAIKSVLVALDKGQLPYGTFSPEPKMPTLLTNSFNQQQRLSSESSRQQPRGIIDFVNRPPFEDRMMVFYPEGRFNPISMARPGFGIWDLDFSRYLLGLAEIDQMDSTIPLTESIGDRGMPMPRASIGEEMDSLVNRIPSPVTPIDGTTTEEEEESNVSAASSTSTLISNEVEILVTPPVVEDDQIPIALAPIISISPPSSPIKSTEEEQVKERPISSFRNVSARKSTSTQSWHYSESETSDDVEEEEEEEDDDQPLAVVSKRVSAIPTTTLRSHLSRPISMPIQLAPRSSPSNIDLAGTTKRTTQADRYCHLPIEQQEKFRQLEQSRAMEAVAKARERRLANDSGEIERRAQGELERKKVDNIPRLPNHSRKHSQPAHSPSKGNNNDNNGQGMRKRYHSFYETPLSSLSGSSSRSSVHAILTPQHTSSTNRASTSPHRHSQAYMIPHHPGHPGQQQGMMYPHQGGHHHHHPAQQVFGTPMGMMPYHHQQVPMGVSMAMQMPMQMQMQMGGMRGMPTSRGSMVFPQSTSRPNLNYSTSRHSLAIPPPQNNHRNSRYS